MPPSNTSLRRYDAPFDWPALEEVIARESGVIAEGMIATDTIDAVNAEIDAWLAAHEEGGAPASGNPLYDAFLGHNTIRLHGLCEKVPGTNDLLAHPELVDWAERAIAPLAASVRLNAGELIQIGPGEPAQMLHRDSDSWPLPVGPDPCVVNAIIAFDDCTLENGATYVVPGSHAWLRERQPEPREFARAVMKRGDALLFRGDAIHGGGENVSEGRRRALSISYCAGWLRPVENSFLNVSRESARAASPALRALLGYAAHDGTAMLGGLIGLYEGGDPAHAL